MTDSQPTPEQICRAALIAMGVPRAIVDKLSPGREMDAWVQAVVMVKMPWREAAKKVEEFMALVRAHELGMMS